MADRMLQASVLERLGIAVASTTLAILIGAVIVEIAGYDAVAFVTALGQGAFGSEGNVAYTLRQSTIFILAGVAVAVAFRAGVFNIGVQGQFIVGGFTAAVIIVSVDNSFPATTLGAIAVMLLGTLGAIVAGGAYAALPGLMKAYADANEVITTIMLNFIALGVVYYLIDGHLKAEGPVGTKLPPFEPYVSLPQVVFGDPQFSLVGLAVALLTVVVVYVLMTRTGFGFDMVTSGHQADAARYAGVDEKRMIVSTMTLSGMVAGIAGAVFAIMIQGTYTDPNTIQTYGFDAIAVSLLAANNPLGAVPAGLLFGGLDAGGQYISLNLDVPSELVEGIFGLIVLFVAVPELFRMAGRYTNLGGDRE